MRYLIGALVLLALLFLAWWLFSRGKQRKLDQQRAEAASIRAGAEERGAALRGQEAFAQQADERAALARHDAEERARQAEESAREAQRVEEEARRHQGELERARLQHDAELRRADELDPDVTVDKDDPRPLPEDLDDHVRPLDETRTHAPVGADRGDDHSPRGGGALATGAGAAVIGSAYAASRGDVSDDEAQRLASGADYRDDGDEWVADGHRSHDDAAFAENSTGGSTDRVEHAERQGHDMTHHDEDARGHDDTRGPDDTDGTTHDLDLEHTSGASRASLDDTTRDSDRDDVADTDTDTDAGLRRDSDTDRDSDSDGRIDSDTDSRTDRGAGSDDDMVIINDVEDYASTEPLPMDEQTPVERSDDDVTTDRRTDEPTTEDTWDDDRTSGDDSSTDARSTGAGATGATAVGAATAGAEGDRHATGSRSDDDTASDDATSEGDSLTEKRATRVSDEDLMGGRDDDGDRARGGDATHWPDGTDRVNTADDDADSADRGRSDRSDETGSTSGSGSDARGEGNRRTSEVDEIRDGGYGVGSAAPIEDRAQPRDHPVQAYRDTMTYRAPGASGYDSAEPDVWFYDEDSARQAGFGPSQA